jgi:DNA-binding transcriptional LysR family regulator
LFHAADQAAGAAGLPGAGRDFIGWRLRVGTLADVARHAVLAYTYLSTGDTWKFERERVAHQLTTRPTMRSNNGDTCRAAAPAGCRIILQPSFMIAADLERGEGWRPVPNRSILAREIQLDAGGSHP